MPSPVDTIPQTTQDFAPYKELLYQLVVVNQYKRIVETGTDVGDSTRILSAALQTTQGQLVTCDVKPPVDDWPNTWPVKNIQFIQGNSAELKIQQPVDLVFLDAHVEGMDLKTHVSAELHNLGRWVRPGGKIVVDDVFHDKFGVAIQQALFEFCKTHDLAWTTYPQGHGLIVVEVSHELPRT